MLGILSDTGRFTADRHEESGPRARVDVIRDHTRPWPQIVSLLDQEA
ncbi:hypothetical protein ACFSC4_20005 [Deinococcus malanensis]|nr:hypothetical protein [Deinococcus malanensis]